jgi:predicted RNA-binding Zn-ribbon protein involved in translation (DUF1610 family)
LEFTDAMIRVTCPNCGAKLKAPDEAAGRETRCPKCGTPITVPEAGDMIYDAEAIPEPHELSGDVYGLDDVPAQKPAPAAAADDGRRPCPMCGEMIMANAAKCRYCGEVFDPALRKAEAKTKRSFSPEDEDMSSGEWVLAVLCSGIGCIVGIVWMIQGKPKGKKMFGVSLLFNILWGILRAVLEQAGRK